MVQIDDTIQPADAVGGAETTPLLTHPLRPPGGHLPGEVKPIPLKSCSIVARCIFLLTIFELGCCLIAIPLNQVLEAIICRNFYPQAPPSVNDLRCKAKAVQDELSIIRGWQSTLELIPSLLTAIPYGFLADRQGREMVLGLSLLGMTLSSTFYILICALPTVFPIRTIWASALLTFVGGGPAVFTAMIYAIAGDAVSEEHRSIMFSYISAAIVGGGLIASPIVYLSMRINVWIPIYTGLVCVIFATIITFTLPKTLQRDPQLKTTEPHLWHQTIRLELAKLGQAVLWALWKNQSVLMLLFTFLIITLTNLKQDTLLQYVTKRHSWSWAEASILLSAQALSNLMLLAILIPSVTYVLVYKWSMSDQYTKLLLARASATSLTLGAFIVGFASSSVVMVIGVCVFALGSGYRPLIRSLLASAVDDNVGMLFTMIGIFETTGNLIAGPLLSVLFRTGMEWGGAWIGLLYITTGCLLAIVTAIVVSTRLSDL
ncbi:MFS general substrate transporter [Colletotrichum sublineola]|nr:MFS general substrate transporter [Colletotrichum sublineola]